MDIDENKSGCAAAQEERGSPPEVERTREPQGHEELQNDEGQATPSRAVFYWALMAAESLEKGVQDYDRLPEIAVVFVTHTNKLFGGMLPIDEAASVFHPCCRDVQLTNRMRVVYANVDNQDPETKLGRLMHDLTCADPDEMFYREIADRVRECKTSDKEVKYMCDYRKKWYEEGVADGKAEGEVARRSIAASLKAQNIDFGVISRSTGLSIEEIEQLPTEAA